MDKSFWELKINTRLTGFVYIILTFSVIPFILISKTNASQNKQELVYEVYNLKANESYFKKIVSREFDANDLNYWFIYDHLDELNSPKDIPSEIVEAYYKKNLMVLKNMVFKTGQLNECWFGNDEFGDYDICLRASNQNYQLGNKHLDSLYLFEKEYS